MTLLWGVAIWNAVGSSLIGTFNVETMIEIDYIVINILTAIFIIVNITFFCVVFFQVRYYNRNGSGKYKIVLVAYVKHIQLS